MERLRLAGVALAFAIVFLWHWEALAHDITIDTSAAEAVVEALGNPQLTEAEARRLTQLPANRALIQRMTNYAPNLGEDRFVIELVASAHHQAVNDRGYYRFDQVRDNRDAVIRTIAAFKRDPAGNATWIDQRLAPFSPGRPLRLQGFLIAGGRPTGFTLGGPSFYLNIGRFGDEPLAARVTLAHELFHAVQSEALRSMGRSEDEFQLTRYQSFDSRMERNRYAVRAYLTNLLQEGLAHYVGDPMLMANEGPYSRSTRDQLQGLLARPELLAGLLEVSLVAITADRPAAFQDAYGVGFYGWASPMYALGYQIAKAIDERRGRQRLRELVVGSGCDFVNEYLMLTREDTGLPPLGPETRRLVGEACREPGT